MLAHTIRANTDHVVIHYARPRETALDGDGAIAMRLHQALEEPVAEDEDVLATVERFSKAQQLYRVPSEAMTLSRAALKLSGESTENGIASRAIHSSSVACMRVGSDIG